MDSALNHNVLCKEDISHISSKSDNKIKAWLRKESIVFCLKPKRALCGTINGFLILERLQPFDTPVLDSNQATHPTPIDIVWDKAKLKAAIETKTYELLDIMETKCEERACRQEQEY